MIKFFSGSFLNHKAHEKHKGIHKEMQTTKQYIDELSRQILSAAIEVNKTLKAGLLESLYEKCFIHELSLRGLSCKSQCSVPINYKGLEAEGVLRLDVIVEDSVIVELKTVEGILPIHKSVVLSYMQMLQKPKGMIFNFNCVNLFREGFVSLVNDHYAKLF